MPATNIDEIAKQIVLNGLVSNGLRESVSNQIIQIMDEKDLVRHAEMYTVHDMTRKSLSELEIELFSSKQIDKIEELSQEAAKIRPIQRNPDFERGILECSSIHDAHRKTGIHYQMFKRKLQRIGIYKWWLEQAGDKRFRERQKEKVLIPNFINQLIGIACKKQGWGYEKAWEYCSRPKKSVSFHKLAHYLEMWKEAKETGTYINNQLIARKAGFPNYSSVQYAIEELGIREIKRFPQKWQREAIKRAVPLNINAPDIAYFLDVSQSVVNLGFKRAGRTGQPGKYVKHFYCDMLTYRDASLIYEAGDAKFTLKEICELVNKPKRIIKYALDHKKEIAPVIKDTLDTLFQEGHKKPYWSSTDRKRLQERYY